MENPGSVKTDCPIDPLLPKELLVHIGDMTVSFSALEGFMQDLLVVLVNTHKEKVGEILGTYLSFSNLRAALISLYKMRHGETVNYHNLKELMVRAGKIKEERNRITHSTWASGEARDLAMLIKRTAREKYGFAVQGEEYNSDKLLRFAVEIRSLAMDVFTFMLKLQGIDIDAGFASEQETEEKR